MKNDYVYYARFERITVVNMKNTIFWCVIKRGSVASYCQRYPYLDYSLQLEDEGGIFLRNVGSYNSHTASDPRRRHSSRITLLKVTVVNLAFGKCFGC
jgi:hypothetical protein